MQIDSRIGIEQSHTVGTDQSQPGASNAVDQSGLAGAALRARLGEPGADNDQRADTFPDAGFDDFGHGARRHGHDGQVDGVGDGVHGREGRDAQHRTRRGVHHVQASPVPAGHDVVEEFRPDLAALTVGADDGDAGRLEERLHDRSHLIGGHVRHIRRPVCRGSTEYDVNVDP